MAIVNPRIAVELDSIASELDMSGNSDLATMVDQVHASLSAKPKAAAAKPKVRARHTVARTRTRTASKLKLSSIQSKIARASIKELHDIASELMLDGDRKTARAVLKHAEDLAEQYDYSKPVDDVDVEEEDVEVEDEDEDEAEESDEDEDAMDLEALMKMYEAEESDDTAGDDDEDTDGEEGDDDDDEDEDEDEKRPEMTQASTLRRLARKLESEGEVRLARRVRKLLASPRK